jgi:hypothetical protein
VETDLALLVGLVVLRKVDVDGLRTTTLSVLDSGSRRAARSNLLALGSILHGVVELEVYVELDGHIDVRNREAGLPLVTAERSRLLLADRVLDALAAECALRDEVALAERVGALPAAREVKVAIVKVRVAILEVRPVEPRLLLVATLVVVVVGRVERAAEHVPCGSGMADKASGEDSLSELHVDRGLEVLKNTAISSILKRR